MANRSVRKGKGDRDSEWAWEWENERDTERERECVWVYKWKQGIEGFIMSFWNDKCDRYNQISRTHTHSSHWKESGYMVWEKYIFLWPFFRVCVRVCVCMFFPFNSNKIPTIYIFMMCFWSKSSLFVHTHSFGVNCFAIAIFHAYKCVWNSQKVFK